MSELRSARRIKKITIQEMAVRLDVRPRTLQNWEYGDYTYSNRMLEGIAKEYGISAERLKEMKMEYAAKVSEEARNRKLARKALKKKYR